MQSSARFFFWLICFSSTDANFKESRCQQLRQIKGDFYTHESGLVQYSFGSVVEYQSVTANLDLDTVGVEPNGLARSTNG